MPTAPHAYGTAPRGVSARDVSQAADALLRAGNRPSVEKIRAQLGGGSPNTINPLLDAWWRTLAARLDSGPAALHRLPETVAQIAEALWMQALDEGRRRAHQELNRTERVLDEQRQAFEVRSHVLTLREGELDSRLKDRERTIDELSLQLRELNLTLRKERATRESIALRLASVESQLVAQAIKRRVPRPVRTAQPQRKTKTRSAKFRKALTRGRRKNAEPPKPSKR